MPPGQTIFGIDERGRLLGLVGDATKERLANKVSGKWERRTRSAERGAPLGQSDGPTTLLLMSQTGTWPFSKEISHD